MKLLILTTDHDIYKWTSLRSYERQILEPLPRNFTLSIQSTSKNPWITKGRVSHVWLKNLIEPYFDMGYDIVALHMSDEKRKELGIKPTLRGSNPRSGGEYGDFYFWADEDTLRNGLPQFIQTFLHELCHEYFQKTGLKDTTHEYHDVNADISGLVASLDWSLYQPERMTLKIKVGLLKTIKGLLEKIKVLQSK